MSSAESSARMEREKYNLARLGNVAVQVSASMKPRQITLSQARALKEEDVIELDMLAGECFTASLNGRPFAEGEIAVIYDQMCLRITRMLPAVEEV